MKLFITMILYSKKEMNSRKYTRDMYIAANQHTRHLIFLFTGCSGVVKISMLICILQLGTLFLLISKSARDIEKWIIGSWMKPFGLSCVPKLIESICIYILIYIRTCAHKHTHTCTHTDTRPYSCTHIYTHPGSMTPQ